MSGKKTKIYISALVIGGLVSLLVLLFFSLLMWILKLPIENANFFSELALCSGILVSSIISGKFMRKGGILTGIKTALLFYFPIAIVSIITNGFEIKNITGKIVTVLICGIVGGIIGVNQKERI